MLHKSLIDLLHLGSLIRSTFNFFERRKVIIVTINAQAQLDHAVDAASKLSWLIEVEARCEQRGVKEQPNQVLDSLVRLVCSRLLPQLTHDGMLGIDLHGLLGD